MLAQVGFLSSLILLFQPPEPQTVILAEGDNYYFVDVHIDGLSEDMSTRFIFDTGANRTAISSQLAQSLGYISSQDPQTVAHSLTQPYLTDTFRLYNLDFGLGPRDLNAIVLQVSEGVSYRANGLIGLDMFRAGTLDINLAEKMIIRNNARPERRDLFLDPQHGLIVGTVHVAGVTDRVDVIIDTGANASLANFALARAAPGPDEIWQSTITDVSGSGPVRSDRSKLFGGIDIGGLCIPSAFVSIADLYAFEFHDLLDRPAIILGTDALEHARIVIDFNTGDVSIDGFDNYAC